MKANPLLFRKEYATSWMAQHQNLQTSVYDSTVASLPESHLDEAVTAHGQPTFTEVGDLFMGQWKLKRDTLYQELYDSVEDIQDDGERSLAFKEGEIEVVKKLNEWSQGTLNSATVGVAAAKTQQQKEDIEIVGEKRVEELQSVMSPENAAKVIALEAEEARQDKTEKITHENINGTLVPAGRSPQKRLENYQKLKKLGTLSDDEVYQANVSIYEDALVNKKARIGFAGKPFMPSEADRLIMGIIPKWSFKQGPEVYIKPPLDQRLEKGTELFELMKVAGVPDETLVSGVFKLGAQASQVERGQVDRRQKGQFSVDFLVENNLLDFSLVPIIIGGSIKNTAAAVQAWKDGGMTLENVDPQHRETLNKIAEKYEMSVSQIMTFQNLYLTTNGYLK